MASQRRPPSDRELLHTVILGLLGALAGLVTALVTLPHKQP
jgi:hypothetical protein